ncbi:hypothetical protein [Aestuariirhabdus sp. LZHN29]
MSSPKSVTPLLFNREGVQQAIDRTSREMIGGEQPGQAVHTLHHRGGV